MKRGTLALKVILNFSTFVASLWLFFSVCVRPSVSVETFHNESLCTCLREFQWNTWIFKFCSLVTSSTFAYSICDVTWLSNWRINNSRFHFKAHSRNRSYSRCVNILEHIQHHYNHDKPLLSLRLQLTHCTKNPQFKYDFTITIIKFSICYFFV